MVFGSWKIATSKLWGMSTHCRPPVPVCARNIVVREYNHRFIWAADLTLKVETESLQVKIRVFFYYYCISYCLPRPTPSAHACPGPCATLMPAIAKNANT